MKAKVINILVTGATGYIGYSFSRYLVEKGFDVHLLVRKSSNLRDLENRMQTAIHYYNGKSDSLEKIFNNNRIEFVFHLATHYDKSDDAITFGKLNDVCIGLTTQLFEVMKKQKNSIGFINVGTIWQTLEKIENAYTLFKIFQEEIVIFLSNKYGIKSISLLLTDSYGPEDWRPKILNQFKCSIRESNQIKIVNLNASYNLIHIDDVCDALYHSMYILKEQGVCFNRFKLQAQTSIGVRELIGLCESISSHTINILYSNESVTSKIFSYKEVDVLPGWEPKIDLVNGLVRFFEKK